MTPSLTIDVATPLPRRLGILAIVLVLAACRGGSGSGTGSTTPGYTVSGTLSGLTAVQSVVLKNNGVDPLTRSANGSFTFATALANGAPYSVTVFTAVAGQSCQVTNGTGTIAAGNVSNVAVACTTVANAGTWSSASRISDARSSIEYELYATAVAVNRKGTAMALWVEEDKSSGIERLWSSCYRGGWSVPSAVAEIGSKDGAVSVLPDGDAIVVYAQQAYEALNLATSQRIYAKRFRTANNSWGAATQISVDFTDDRWPTTPSIASDAKGNALAVWTHDRQVWARRYIANSGWSTAAIQLSDSPRSASSPKVVADANGVFTAAWIEDSDAYNPALPGGGPNKSAVVARRLDGEWGVEHRIGWSPADLAGKFDSANRLSLDANAAGSVLVVWEQTRTLADGSNQKSIDAAHFAPERDSWSRPEIIATHSASLSWPRVALADNGRALAIWMRSETQGEGATSLRGSWFNPTTRAWGPPELFDQTGSASISDAVLAMDAAGNVELAWNEVGKGMVEHRFNAKSGTWGGWNTRPPSGSDLQLAMSDTGHAVLIGDYLNLNPLPWTREISAWAYAP
jgi:hypothetical protein